MEPIVLVHLKMTANTKTSFSQDFGANMAFWAKLTYIQKPITQDWNKLETHSFFCWKVKTLFFHLMG